MVCGIISSSFGFIMECFFLLCFLPTLRPIIIKSVMCESLQEWAVTSSFFVQHQPKDFPLSPGLIFVSGYSVFHHDCGRFTEVTYEGSVVSNHTLTVMPSLRLVQ